MRESFIDFLIEIRKKEEKYFKNYLKYAKKIKKEAKLILGKKVRVMVFGSILRKDEIARDIDLLIISPLFKNFKKRDEARIRILKKVGFNSPFELHLITPEEYEKWYKHFIKEKLEV